jgi:hypothetical protein
MRLSVVGRGLVVELMKLYDSTPLCKIGEVCCSASKTSICRMDYDKTGCGASALD